MTPFFSIIIPVYNVAPYLRECLDSVLAQTFTDWEAICVDDGCTDGSGAILDEYAAKDPRFRVIHQPNAGVSAARNKALDAVKGKWLTFLDADDLVAENTLAKMINVANSANADLVIGGVLRFGGKNGDVFVGPQENGMYPPEELYVKYNSLCAWSWGKIYKKELWDKIRFPVGIAYSEDRYVLHEILYAYAKVPFVAEKLYLYRARSDSAYGAIWKSGMIQRRYAFVRQMTFFREKGFERSELFTAGLYFKWISHDISKLANEASPDWGLIKDVRGEFCRVESTCWQRFAKMAKHEHWVQFPSCGELRIRMDMAISPHGRVSRTRRVLNILKYDGARSVCRKMILKMKRCL